MENRDGAFPIAALPVEVLTEVLLHLGADDPSTLLHCQRVCRTWHSLITNTPSLQKALYFISSSSPPDMPFDINPLLRQHFGPLLIGRSHNAKPLKARKTNTSAKYDAFYMLPWMYSERARSRVLRAEASWRRMLITSSPIRKLTELRTTWHRWPSITWMTIEFPREPVPLECREIRKERVDAVDYELEFEESEEEEEESEEEESEIYEIFAHRGRKVSGQHNSGPMPAAGKKVDIPLVPAATSMGCSENGEWPHGMTMGAYYSLLFDRKDWRDDSLAPDAGSSPYWKLFPSKTVTYKGPFESYWIIPTDRRPGWQEAIDALNISPSAVGNGTFGQSMWLRATKPDYDRFSCAVHYLEDNRGKEEAVLLTCSFHGCEDGPMESDKEVEKRRVRGLEWEKEWRLPKWVEVLRAPVLGDDDF